PPVRPARARPPLLRQSQPSPRRRPRRAGGRPRAPAGPRRRHRGAEPRPRRRARGGAARGRGRRGAAGRLAPRPRPLRSAPGMSPPRVSAILVNLDCGPLVDLVFPSLARQTWRDLEVVVVDNGSTDGSAERIEREFPGTRVVRLGRNTGFSHALNAGIRATSGEYVLSLNFDVVLEPGFVAALIDALERHPEAGWAAGALRQLRPEGVVDAIDCYGHWMLPSRYVYGCDPARRRPDQYPAECLVFGASACGALYRRRMLDDLSVDGEIF